MGFLKGTAARNTSLFYILIVLYSARAESNLPSFMHNAGRQTAIMWRGGA